MAIEIEASFQKSGISITEEGKLATES
jgi:hypothetical protein